MAPRPKAVDYKRQPQLEFARRKAVVFSVKRQSASAAHIQPLGNPV
jgi:hypothetical protein